MNAFERRDRRVCFSGSAGVQPEKLQGVPEPKDFDALWARRKARLKALPMDGYSMKPVRSNEVATVYEMSVPCPGPRPATGYLTLPNKPGKYPGRLYTDGYNGFSGHQRPIEPGGPYIAFHLNAHGYELGREDEYYREFYDSLHGGDPVKAGLYGRKWCTYAFDVDKNSDPDTAYFCGMAYRVLRALQFVKSLPQWDGKNLIASGGSQGGLQTIWAAALDHDVSQADACVPWCCDMGGEVMYKRLRESWYLHWTPALGYYDPINMARRIPKTCRTNITRAGLGDYCCPPSGVAILYNNIPGNKSIRWVQGSTHGEVPPEKHQWFVCEEN